MNCKEIIKKYLLINNFDGLYNEWDCGCLVDDLMCCGESCDNCIPGYKWPGNEDYDYLVKGEKYYG